MILSYVERQMESLLKIFNFEIGTAIMFNHFNSRYLSFVNSIHEFPWAMSLVGDFLDLLVKKQMLSTFDYLLELLPILNSLRQLVLFKVFVTICIPPTLGMFGDVNNL